MNISTYQAAATVDEHGKLVLESPATFAQSMRQFKPGPVVVTVDRRTDRRSHAANRFLWGVVYAHISEYTGADPEDIHDEMCARFTTRTVSYANPHTGEMVETEVVGRTSRMSVKEFYEFVEKVRLFAAEFFGLTIPDPDPEYVRHRREAQEAA